MGEKNLCIFLLFCFNNVCLFVVMIGLTERLPFNNAVRYFAAGTGYPIEHLHSSASGAAGNTIAQESTYGLLNYRHSANVAKHGTTTQHCTKRAIKAHKNYPILLDESTARIGLKRGGKQTATTRHRSKRNENVFPANLNSYSRFGLIGKGIRCRSGCLPRKW